MARKSAAKKSEANLVAKRKKNAEAQALFRQRRAEYITDLEETVSQLRNVVEELRKMHSTANEEIRFYKERAQHFEATAAELKAQLPAPPSLIEPASELDKKLVDMEEVDTSPVLPMYDVMQDSGIYAMCNNQNSPWIHEVDDGDRYAPHTASLYPACPPTVSLGHPAQIFDFCNPLAGSQQYLARSDGAQPMEDQPQHLAAPAHHFRNTQQLTDSPESLCRSPAQSASSCSGALTPLSFGDSTSAVQFSPLSPIFAPITQSAPLPSAASEPRTAGPRPKTLPERFAKCEEALRYSRQMLALTREEMTSRTMLNHSSP